MFGKLLTKFVVRTDVGLDSKSEFKQVKGNRGGGDFSYLY